MAEVQDKAERVIRALKSEAGQSRKLSDEDAVKKTIVEDVDESFFEGIVIKAARKLVLRKYGKLNVSLKNSYLASFSVSAFLSYFVYDFIYGAKSTV